MTWFSSISFVSLMYPSTSGEAINLCVSWFSMNFILGCIRPVSVSWFVGVCGSCVSCLLRLLIIFLIELA